MYAPYHDLPLSAFSSRIVQQLEDKDWLEKVNINKLSDNCIRYCRKNNITLRRGDLFGISELSTYRNDRMFIFDGNVVEHLYYDVDDCGSIPPTYRAFTDFPIDYFHSNPVRHISHNRIVWFDISPFKEELLENLVQIDDDTSKTVFSQDQIEYSVYFDDTFDGVIQFLSDRTLVCFERDVGDGVLSDLFDVKNEVAMQAFYLTNYDEL